jgi:hypothetical protein
MPGRTPALAVPGPPPKWGRFFWRAALTSHCGNARPSSFGGYHCALDLACICQTDQGAYR